MNRSTPASDGNPGFWVISENPRVAEIVDSVVARSGVSQCLLPCLPEPEWDAPSVRPDWILVDLESRGFRPEHLRAFKERQASCQVFVLAGDPSQSIPPEISRIGIRHWFDRPLDRAELRRVFRAALRSRRAEIDRARRKREDLRGFDELIGQAPAFREACELARRAARSPCTVILLEGETGTGKGVLARAIHRESPRSDGPYLEVSCASLPGSLLESELFGHERGAFTHATAAKPGLLELADSGTFFLDEVGETDPRVQAKVLKFLDSGRYRRVGGVEEREVDVRILAATQKNLHAEVEAGRFRGDLFHRINVLRIRIPPIREREGDADLLLDYYLVLFSNRLGNASLRWSDGARERLRKHPWPGNVREIVNLCERMALLRRDHAEILPEDLTGLMGKDDLLRVVGSEFRLRVEIPPGVTFDEIEKAILATALEREEGNVSRAAASLGMGRGQFRYRMARLGMEDSSRPARRRSRRRRPRSDAA